MKKEELTKGQRVSESLWEKKQKRQEFLSQIIVLSTIFLKGPLGFNELVVKLLDINTGRPFAIQAFLKYPHPPDPHRGDGCGFEELIVKYWKESGLVEVNYEKGDNLISLSQKGLKILINFLKDSAINSFVKG